MCNPQFTNLSKGIKPMSPEKIPEFLYNLMNNNENIDHSSGSS